MITAEEARRGAPSWSYKVGVVAGLPGALMLPVIIGVYWIQATGGRLADFRGEGWHWVPGTTYLAVLLWAMLGPAFVMLVTLAAVSTSRGPDAGRGSTVRRLAWVSLTSWTLVVAPMVLQFSGHLSP